MKYYNRATKTNYNIDRNEEFQLLGNVGTMEQNRNNEAQFTWTEPSITTTGGNQTTNYSITNLIQKPKNTKYPSTPFYWRTSGHVGTLFNQTTIIPGKEHHLDSGVYEEDTWQRLPGLVTYNNDIERGGKVTTTWNTIEHGNNTYLTLIWQPRGRLSGNPLIGSGNTNTLEVDMIHTLFWDQ